MSNPRPLDPQLLQMFTLQVFTNLSGAVVASMIYLGDRLGLYRALSQGGPATTGELAQRTGLNERWLTEWLHNQAAAQLVERTNDGRFGLSPEAVLVLADENSPFFAAGGFHSLPQQMAVLEKLPESFRSGVGLPYDAFGPEGATGIERFFAPWFKTFLVPLALPTLDGVADRLRAGAKAADVGCGAGVALIEMARAYPKSEFHGYDISRHALERAERNRAEAGVANVTFHDASNDRLPGDHSFDLITTFDCLHDMTHPEEVMQAIRAALRPDGTWFIADIKAMPTYEENVGRNPMAAMMYGMSVMTCMSSALSEPGGAGLGTLGLHEQLARDMASRAGFSRFRRIELEHPVNAFYEARP